MLKKGLPGLFFYVLQHRARYRRYRARPRRSRTALCAPPASSSPTLGFPLLGSHGGWCASRGRGRRCGAVPTRTTTREQSAARSLCPRPQRHPGGTAAGSRGRAGRTHLCPQPGTLSVESATRNAQPAAPSPERTTRNTEPGTHSPQHRAELLPEDASHGLRSFRTIMSLQRTLLVSGFTGLLVADAGRDGGRAGLPPVWLRSMRHLVCACSAPAPPCAGREGAGWVSTAAGLGTQGDQGEQDVQTYY